MNRPENHVQPAAGEDLHCAPGTTAKRLLAPDRLFPVIVLAILAFRLFFLVNHGIRHMWIHYWGFGYVFSWEYNWDAPEYEAMADDFADGHQDSVSYRTPGYPVLLNLTRTDPPNIGAIVANQVMSVITGVLIFMLLRLRSPAIAMAAALLSLLYLPYVAYSYKLLPDTMALLLAVLASVLHLGSREAAGNRKGLLGAAAAGLVISMGVLVKPVLQFAVLPLITVDILHRGGRRLPAILARCAVLLAFSYLMPGLWRHHNESSFGLPALSTQDAYEPLARCAVLAGAATLQEVRTGVYTDGIDSLAMVEGRLDYGIRDSLYRAETRRFLRTNFWDIVPPHFLNFGDFANHRDAMNLASDFFWTGNETVLALHGVATLLVAIYCMLGIVLLLLSARKRRLGGIESFLLVWTALFVVVFGPTDNLIRYGMMIYWSAFAAASMGFASALRRRAGADGTGGRSMPQAGVDKTFPAPPTTL